MLARRLRRVPPIHAGCAGKYSRPLASQIPLPHRPTRNPYPQIRLTDRPMRNSHPLTRLPERQMRPTPIWTHRLCIQIDVPCVQIHPTRIRIGKTRVLTGDTTYQDT